MKYLTVLCFGLGLVCTAFAAPSSEDNALLVLPQRELHLLEDSQKLIQNFVSDLQKTALDALNTVKNLTDGIRDEAKQVRDEIRNNVEKLSQRIKRAVDNVWQKVSNTSTAVRACVDFHRKEAANLFNDTVSQTLLCVDDSVADIRKQVNDLSIYANEALKYGNKVLDDMKKCTETKENLFSSGVCLAGVMLRAETNAVWMTSRITVMIGRINVRLATLPVSMEVCAGNRLFQTTIESGRIIMKIGGCSTNNIITGIFGGNNNTPNNY